jgi:NAD(P)-dependent dehydrogenase (short-subunit alcohol dehydrogenase family)
MLTYDFSGKTALITGAASGIGKATALAFAKANANVVLADIAKAAGAELAQTIQDAGGHALFVATDVANAEQVAQLMQAAVTRFGAVDYAFNNAGIEEEQARLAHSEEALFDRMMAINVKGVWLCMKHELLQMQQQRFGVIVNTASVAGLGGAPKHAIYAATKHAVVGLTKSAAAEYGSYGIRINSVCPAVIRTPMFERVVAAKLADAEAITRMHPIGRIGEVEEVASAVLWLCSDAASFVTGHQLAVDGGFTAI